MGQRPFSYYIFTVIGNRDTWTTGNIGMVSCHLPIRTFTRQSTGPTAIGQITQTIEASPGGRPFRCHDGPVDSRS